MRCVLVCGAPASGKSTLARALAERLKLPMMSKDDIKEILFDTVGFTSRAEKVALGEAAMRMLYAFAETMMRAGQPFILENNFESVSRPGLERLLAAYSCRPIEVFCSCELRTLYTRFAAREGDPSRHRGHVVNTRYPEPEGERAASQPISFEQFATSIQARGMLDFTVGAERIVVDTTDFAGVDDREVAGRVGALMRCGRSIALS